MRKFITLLLLLSFAGLEFSPAQAFLKSTIEKNTLIEQKKADKELYKKVKKQKDIPFRKLKVTNKYDFINQAWWEGFNDPYLTEYITKAMEHNYDLKIATLTVDEYYQNVRYQMSNELPQVDGGYGLGVMGMPISSTERDTLHGLGIPFIASYEADIFLKNHDKTTSVRKQYQATISDERATYISIVASVGTTYYNIVKLDKTISIQEEIVNLRKQIYDLMALSNKYGVTSVSDMIKANKSYIASQSDLLDYKRQRVELLDQLAVLIGESPENIKEFKRISYDEIVYKNIVPESIPSDIIVQRPDYIRAEVMLKKAGIDVRVAKKEFLPTISISGLALFNAKYLGKVFTTKNSMWGVSGSVMQPLFTGGARIANLKINKIKFEKALREYQKVNLTAIQEVNDALYTAKLDNQKLIQNKHHLDLETTDYGLSQKQYEEGTISKLDLFQMQENLLTIRKLVASNTLDCMIDTISIYKATGAKF